MGKMIAACGLDCAVCPAYVAAMTNDEALRKKTAEEWTKAFGFDCKPEMVNCHGCFATDGIQVSHCDECEIRQCAVTGKSLENCAACHEYTYCGKLAAFLKQAPEAKKNLADAALLQRRALP
jgi:Protein of unknown function (DUF3795)